MPAEVVLIIISASESLLLASHALIPKALAMSDIFLFIYPASSTAFSAVLLIMLIPFAPSRAIFTHIALEDPPAPKTTIFLSKKFVPVSSAKSLLKPLQSVLYP